MESGPFSSSPVKAESKKFVMLRVDGDKDKAHTQAAGVSGFPTFQILDPDGKEVWKQPGYIETDSLVQAMEAGLAKAAPQGK